MKIITLIEYDEILWKRGGKVFVKLCRKLLQEFLQRKDNHIRTQTMSFFGFHGHFYFFLKTLNFCTKYIIQILGFQELLFSLNENFGVSKSENGASWDVYFLIVIF